MKFLISYFSWFAQIIAGFKIKHGFFLGIVQMSALTALRG